ncbi:glutamate/aspartate transport system permease protein [Azorhizobium sp. AG788]|uniref:amino acid ABC transporter permease n=1 Tax=Azorhizobium sp. AG788 TaxID=2183897 RepID=UPI00105DC4D9|nr:amino acid ABC transporter permease [Azorhizobium sp. AG788]TDT99111.1 glutamate/aspartate transport system permease protein [Azorhizobium sp. AG788]
MNGYFDFGAIAAALPYLLGDGLGLTFGLTVLAGAMGFGLGILLAVLRLSPLRLLSVPATLYVNLVRSVPLVLIIFWFYFLVPYIGAWLVGSSRPIQVGAFRSALVSFTLFEAAYFCEIIRGGIQSIRRGQISAGLALGLTRRQTFLKVVLPQAIRNMTPSLLTRLIVLFQDTSLVYVVGLTDFLGAASKVGARDGRLTEFYVFVAVVYLVICFAASRLVKRLELRWKVAR